MKYKEVPSIIFSSTITGYTLKLLQFFVSIITLPLVVEALGKVQYGILVLIGQTVGFLAMTDIGVSNSIGRFISRYNSATGRGPAPHLPGEYKVPPRLSLKDPR